MNKIALKKVSFFHAGNPLKPKTAWEEFGYTFEDFTIIKGACSFGQNFHSQTAWYIYRGYYDYTKKGTLITITKTLREAQDKILKILAKESACQSAS
jgi:hypothetical protein